MSESFQEKFCRRFAITPERYGAAMLRRTLHDHARWFRWLFAYDFLAADRCFIASVGRLTRRSDFSGEVTEFRCDERNQGFWRRTVRLRISSNRMLALFQEVWPESREQRLADGSGR